MKVCNTAFANTFIDLFNLPAHAHETTTRDPARRLRALLAVGFALICAAALPAAASAQSFVVDTASDSGALTCATKTTVDADCSLRGAISEANLDTAADIITFSGTWVISINSPLPDVERPLTINSASQNVVVTGGGGYICTPGVFAIDITDPAAQPATIRGLPFNAVCGRAIRSNMAPPTIAVGPRRADNTVSITGSSGSATAVDLFRAEDVLVEGEADTDGFIASISALNGVYSYTPGSQPGPTEIFAATATGAAGTSNFSPRVGTPADLTSPLLNHVVAVSTSVVRLDFNESLSGGSAQPSAYSLGMANIGRPIVGASVNGNSVYLTTNVPWGAGEAGAISMTGNGRVVDPTGNELLGLPTAPVYAGPGEIDVPVISNFKLAPNRFCQRKSKACKRGTTSINITLNKPARVIFKVARGTARRSELVTFVHRLKAGRNKVKFDAVVSGRTLPAAVLTLRASAQDVARTMSAPVDAAFRVVKNKRDL